MEHEELIGRHERLFGEITTCLKDIQEQMHINKQEAQIRRAEEMAELRDWRGRITDDLDKLKEAISEIKPNYRRVLAAMGFVVAGCMAAMGKLIWEHVRK
jgi:hypothetical protein